MKIQKKYTTAARGMMAMKKDVAKDVMANLAENGTMFDKDKDKGKTGKMQGPKKSKVELYPKGHPIFEGGKFIQKEDGMIVRNPNYREPEKPAEPPKKRPSIRERELKNKGRERAGQKGEKGMTYKKGPGGMMISFVRKNK